MWTFVGSIVAQNKFALTFLKICLIISLIKEKSNSWLFTGRVVMILLCLDYFINYYQRDWKGCPLNGGLVQLLTLAVTVSKFTLFKTLEKQTTGVQYLAERYFGPLTTKARDHIRDSLLRGQTLAPEPRLATVILILASFNLTIVVCLFKCVYVSLYLPVWL